jgi:hypothetical protein
MQSKFLNVIDVSDEIIYDFKYKGYETLCYNLSKKKSNKSFCHKINEIVPVNILHDSISYIRDNQHQLIASAIPERFLRAWVINTPSFYRKYFVAMPDLLISVKHLDDSFLPLKVFVYIYAYITDSWLMEDSLNDDAENMAYKLFVYFQQILADSLNKTVKNNLDIVADLRVKILNSTIQLY